MKNLIIGNSSQLSHYFPKNYEKISSRNIDLSYIKTQDFDRIFLTFAEQRTYLNKSLSFFTDINVEYTLFIIDQIINSCNKIVIYGTSELWNSYDGCVDIDYLYKYNYTHYIKSKEILCKHIKNSDKYDKVIIIHPFNFNSIYRKGNFLFGKIYKSITLNQKITVGNINIYRDIIHPQFVVNESISAQSDSMVGSGILINIKEFIEDMYKKTNKNFNDYVSINMDFIKLNIRNNYYSCQKRINYNDLLNMYINDILVY